MNKLYVALGLVILIFHFFGFDFTKVLSSSNHKSHPPSQTLMDCNRVEDSMALVSFYQNVDITNLNWNFDFPINSWNYVELKMNGCVDRLKMSQLSLGNSTYSIPASIGDLTDVWEIDLHNNFFIGSIPAEIGQLTTLGELWLDDNELTGNIPDTFSNLEDLQLLYLNHNKLSGEIPSSIFQLTNLRTLHLEGNDSLSGILPGDIEDLKDLVLLSLSGNLFEGPIPGSLNNLNDLDILRLSDNNFDSLPKLYANNFDSLFYLSLEENYFTFDDILPNMSLGMKVLQQEELETTFSYAPQKEVRLPETFFLSPCSPIVDLGFDDTVTTSIYVWYKDFTAFETTNVNYIDLSQDLDLSAQYHCEITNPNAPDLTLITKNFSIALITGSDCIYGPDTLYPMLGCGEQFQIDTFIFDENTPTGCAFYTVGNCDSVIYVNLDFYQNDTIIVDNTICEEDTKEVNGKLFNCPTNGIIEIDTTSQTGCDTIYIINLACGDCGFIPNAFTPNGDGINDLFVIPLIGANPPYVNYELIIMSRYKKVVYQKMGYDNTWNGEDMNGNLLPAGTYYYIFNIKEAESKTGIVTIIR